MKFGGNKCQESIILFRVFCGGLQLSQRKGNGWGHQFNKIEMFQFTKTEDSWKAFDESVNAEELVRVWDLIFRRCSSRQKMLRPPWLRLLILKFGS